MHIEGQIIIDMANDFSVFLGRRLKSDGEYSAEEFVEFVIPYIKLTRNMDCDIVIL